MTIIIGYKSNNRLHFGADSRASTGGNIFTLEDSKVFKKGNMLFGVCGHWRAAQIIKHKFKPPTRSNDMMIEEYINTVFIDELRECFKENGYAEINNNVENAKGAYLVVGILNRIFDICYDYCVIETTDNFICSGSGEEYARGALHAIEMSNKTPEEKIKIALEAACRFNNGCAPPFTIITNSE